MTVPVKLKKHSAAAYQTVSESSSHPDPGNTSTPNFTPSETPPQIPNAGLSELPDPENVELSKMEEAKGDGSQAKEGVLPVLPSVADSPATQVETKAPDAVDSKTKKVACRKHTKVVPGKVKKRSKPKADESSTSDDTSSSDDSSSSSESEASTESESSSEDEAEAAKKRKLKAKKAKKLKEKKKAKSRKNKEASEEESESSSSDDSSSEEEEKRKKSKSKKKRRSKKNRKDTEDSSSEEDETDPIAIAKLNAQYLQRTLRRRGRGGRHSIDDRLLKKSISAKAKGKKKKR